jgi:hypothetical protein
MYLGSSPSRGAPRRRYWSAPRHRPWRPVKNRFVAIGGVLAIELGHELLVGKHDDIGEFAVFHLQRLERIDRLARIGRAEQLDKKIDVHHVKQASRVAA